MARGKSVRLLGKIPARYSPDFMERLDRRTVLGKAVCQRFETIATDCGGLNSLSHIQVGIIKRFIWMEAVIEGFELQLAAGDQIDLGSYTQTVNSWIGLARMLGLERQPRPVRRLHEHLKAAS